MKILNIVLVFVVALFFYACTTDPDLKHIRSIYITSNPEGASLIVNGIAMPKTPVTIEVEATENGCFLVPTQIIALATDKKTHTQITSYPAYNVDNLETSTVPEKIEFDMTILPAKATK